MWQNLQSLRQLLIFMWRHCHLGQHAYFLFGHSWTETKMWTWFTETVTLFQFSRYMTGIWLLLCLHVVGHRYVTGPEVPIHRGAQKLNLPFLHSQRQISQVTVADSKAKPAAFFLEACHVLNLLSLLSARPRCCESSMWGWLVDKWCYAKFCTFLGGGGWHNN